MPQSPQDLPDDIGNPEKRSRIAFLLKHRDNAYGWPDAYSYSCGELSSGLYNSSRLVQEMLRDRLGYVTTIAHIVDNNAIDAFVHKWRPDIVVIEAYWVIPEKFAILTRLHPNILWVIRNHSSMPFLALEGVVMDWSLRYMDYPNVVLSSNEPRTNNEFAALLRFRKPDNPPIPVLLPNYYPALGSIHPDRHKFTGPDNVLNVGCFGAIRPLKNHLIQAVAAMKFCEAHNYELHFHVNSTRVEQYGEPVLRNLRSLFREEHQHKLIEHSWMDHDNFVQLIRDEIDIGLQVSFAETFSIFIADCVTSKIPVVVSPEISWVDKEFQASPNDSGDIKRTMVSALYSPNGIRKNLDGLEDYDDLSAKLWEQFINPPGKHE